jgi:hypothetical protein
MTDRLLTDDELADRIGKSTWFVQAQCKAKKWPHQRIGKSYRVTAEQVAAIDALLEVKAKTTTTTEATPNPFGRKGRSA